MKTVAFIFGRMNPITAGHLHLIAVLADQAADSHLVYLSHTQDKKKNPLPYESKAAYVEKAIAESYPSVELVISDCRTALEVLKEFNGNYTDVIFVAGSDRTDDFEKIFDAYNNKPTKTGEIIYSFNSITVISAGERDEDSEGIEGVSASKMRQFAANNDFESFYAASAFASKDITRHLFDELRTYL